MASVSLGACAAWLDGDQKAATQPQSAPQAQSSAPQQTQEQVPNAASRRLVRNVQQQLQAKGIGPGPVDGIWGPQTQSALEQFQQQQGLQASGQLNGATLSALGVVQQSGQDAFARADRDNDRSLDRREFQAAIEMKGDSASAGGSSDKPTFRNLDANDDGQLTLAESAADTRISRDFERADRNNDYRLDREEFRAALESR
ncbi:MAG TPA: peptidoglycan-binding protein [Burkholderiales bacterium]